MMKISFLILLASVTLSGCGTIGHLEPGMPMFEAKDYLKMSVNKDDVVVARRNEIMFTYSRLKHVSVSAYYTDAAIELVPSDSSYRRISIAPGVQPIYGVLRFDGRKLPAILVTADNQQPYLLPIEDNGVPNGLLFKPINYGMDYLPRGGTWTVSPPGETFKTGRAGSRLGDHYALVYRGIDGAFLMFSLQNVGTGEETRHKAGATTGTSDWPDFTLTVLEFSAENIRFRITPKG